MIFYILFIKPQPARLLYCFILAKAMTVAKSPNGDFGKSTPEHAPFSSDNGRQPDPLQSPSLPWHDIGTALALCQSIASLVRVGMECRTSVYMIVIRKIPDVLLPPELRRLSACFWNRPGVIANPG